jgi:hypothetical protein
MLPENIGVATKRKDAIVGLRKVDAKLVFGLQGFGANKGQFASGTKADSDSNVLAVSALGIKGSRIMVKGFPIRTAKEKKKG